MDREAFHRRIEQRVHWPRQSKPPDDVSPCIAAPHRWRLLDKGVHTARRVAKHNADPPSALPPPLVVTCGIHDVRQCDGFVHERFIVPKEQLDLLGYLATPSLDHGGQVPGGQRLPRSHHYVPDAQPA